MQYVKVFKVSDFNLDVLIFNSECLNDGEFGFRPITFVSQQSTHLIMSEGAK